ncbi:Hsp20/alpha crystallin family protein [Rickettsia amblyommatis]|uniref:Small heat shock protein n=1 Tax=Rickettsia amblyommatis (strain GAT-30V) TaxID=1105111 RepID=H8K6A9_RICAG|nr:Hsp20/alpha crystallin family protein [Rickettsia amblyommatis]AFC70420.1 small heat shock protein [Rickettsia amblyommatis str. GAT-30V]KJV99916.1 hsp20/alpha crystallin family protein [Rickettsia amblyommatis str. Darkwater]
MKNIEYQENITKAGEMIKSLHDIKSAIEQQNTQQDLRQDNIDLKIDSNILTIEGKKEKSSEQQGHNYHMQERYYGSFYRSISLPSNIDEEHIEVMMASYLLRYLKKNKVKLKKLK